MMKVKAVLVLFLAVMYLTPANAADEVVVGGTGTTGNTGNSTATFEVKGGKKLDPVNWYVETTVAGTKYDSTKVLTNVQGGVKGSVTIVGGNYVGKQKVVLKVKLADGTTIASVETTVDFQKMAPNPCPAPVCPPPPPPPPPTVCPTLPPSEEKLTVPELACIVDPQWGRTGPATEEKRTVLELT